ncbi:MAG: transglycosylase domain-containing protein [Bacteroidetes bacterium]|nr:transglycosylase domain-containing protein [Bacteroidota bacterium]
MSVKKQTAKSRSWRRLLFKVFFTGILLCAILLFSLIVLVRIGAFSKMPSYADLKNIKNNTATNIYSVDNTLVGRYYYQNRTNARLGDLPEHLTKALIATEDVRFYQHTGVDFRSTLRVLVKTVILFDRSAGGGSTITQQLAKNLFGRSDHGFLTIPVAKIKEILIARRIEKLYSKDEILELYLNTVSFGENTYGIETASILFYNKEPSKLKIEESAVLIGLLKANTSYNPRMYKQAAQKRRNIVLSQMCKYGYITHNELDSLKTIPLSIRYKKLTYTEGPAPYFREYLRKECVEILKGKKKPDGSSYNLYTDGLKVYTTLNAQMQDYLEAAVESHMAKLQVTFDKEWKGKEPWIINPKLASLQIKQSKAYQSLIKKGLTEDEAIAAMKVPRQTEIFTWNGIQDTLISPLDSLLHHFKTLQTGAMVMNGTNGDILAWVGGVNYKFFKYDHVTAKRQTGSTIKPIVYASALRHGIKPCDFYENDSLVYDQFDNWTPKNSDGGYGGFYSVKGALANSVNTISVKLLMETGIDSTISLAHQMGINSELPEVPSLALGTGEVSLYEMVNAYATFLNYGQTIKPRIVRRIEDANGNLLYADNAHEPGDTVLERQITETVLAMMQGVVDRGTAKSLRSIWKFESDFVGKTGTTQHNTDAWFIGMTPKLVTGVWVGGDNPVVRFKTTTYGQGAYSALPVFANFYQKLYKDSKYAYLANEKFSISDSTMQLLDCDDFNEEGESRGFEFFKKDEESIGDFIKRIFKRNKRKKSNHENDPE